MSRRHPLDLASRQVYVATEALRTALAALTETTALLEAAANAAEHTGEVALARRSLRESGLSLREAAARLGLMPAELNRMLRRGEIIGVPFGGKVGWRLAPEYVESLVRGRDASQAQYG